MGFATGFSAGANAVNSYKNRKRQEEKDAQDAEIHTERMAEVAQAKADKQAMRDAGAERTTMQGTAVTTGAGDKNLYSDPAQAAQAADDAKIEAEMRGQQPSAVTMQGATGITGNMAKGHQITTEPVNMASLNSAEAKAGRFQSALEAQGKPLEAMQMGNAVMENKAKKMGLEVAELDFANRKFNTDVLSGIDADPDWTKGAANLLTKTQLGGFAGKTVTPAVSADGKTVSFVGAGADGATQTLFTLPNTPQGKLQFTQQILKASPEMKVSWLVENAKTAKAEAEALQKQGNWEKDYTLKEKEVNSKGELRVAQAEAAALRGHIAAGRASGGAGSTNGPALKDRRDYLSDFSGSLPDPKTATTPEEAQAINAGNQRILAQADAVFSTNAELGNILTAPQAAAAMRLAQDPANIKRVRDNNTGMVYETVAVNGKPVILGVGSMKPQEAEKPSAQPAAATTKPKATMSSTVAKTYPHAGYETVQGAIDGAKRGDQKAVAYVEQIQNSGLPIQQRDQIKNILSGK